MRTALISALKRTADGDLRANKAFAGRALLDWQVDLALTLDCERVICLCDAPSPVIIAQQQRVEAAGLAFHTARGPLQLPSLVRDEDDVLLLLDGLFVSSEAALELMDGNGEDRHALYTLPASHALSVSYPDDFERIDRDHHWAGLAMISGKCVRGLGDLPGYGDAFSLLLRLALQERTPRRALPAEYLENDGWLLASNEAALKRCEATLLGGSVPVPQWSGPVNALASLSVSRSAPFWLQSAPEVSGLGALGLGVIGAGLAGTGFAVTGLFVAGLAAFAAMIVWNAQEMRSALGGGGQNASWATGGGTILRRGLPIAMGFLAILTLVLSNSTQEDLLLRASLPVFAIVLPLIAGRNRHAGLSAFWRDTPLHLVLFALAAGLGFLQESVIAFSLAALAQLALLSKKQ